MAPLNEDIVEQYALSLFAQLGYHIAHGLPPTAQAAERSNYTDVILRQRLTDAVTRINPHVPNHLRDQAIKQLLNVPPSDLITCNQHIHPWLIDGITVSDYHGGDERGTHIALIDFATPTNNDFLAVNQVTVHERGQHKRADIVVFVNGLPLVVIELKNPTDADATIDAAFRQLQTYLSTIPRLFQTNAFVVISDGLDARVGTITSAFTRFLAWKTRDGKTEAPRTDNQLATLILGMFPPAILLDLIRHFVVFELRQVVDPTTGRTHPTIEKKIAAYHQYYAVNAALASTFHAMNRPVPPTLFGGWMPAVPVGTRKAGVVWHTQGSGKSLSMLFYSGKLIGMLDNPTLVILTDRNDLDDQLFETFVASKRLLRQNPQQATSREELKALLNVASGGVIFTTIQKFQPATGNVFDELSTRSNIVVIADEAHRSQYGFQGRTVDVKNDDGAVVGTKLVYGFAKYLRDALPNATYLGFTGTPIEHDDVNTPHVFGQYIDIYDIAQSVADGATVRIFYESRLVKVALSEEGRKLIAVFDETLNPDDLSSEQQLKNKWTQLEALIGSHERISRIAHDIVAHFTARQAVFLGKGMIVCASRRIAVALYNAIVALRPDWHADNLAQGAIKVVMTAASSDGPILATHHTTKQQRKLLAERMKRDHDPLQLVIVCDMWLTGFDVPNLHTMYLDKPMRGHGLMQAIARVNRVYKDKPGGLIVDYLGIAAELKEALTFYTSAGGTGDPTILQERAIDVMEEYLEIVRTLFVGFDYQPFFTGDVGTKLNTILAAEEHILSLDDGKKRYSNAVLALSKAFVLAMPHERADAIKEEIAFFQAVKERLTKFAREGSSATNEALETTIRQVIDQALVSDTVVDVFDAAGLKKPDISILSDEFLAELRHFQHPNIAAEVLNRLLADELTARLRTNLVQSRALLELLDAAIRRYHAKTITAAEVIQELIDLSQQIKAADVEIERLRLTPEEYAFYTAVAHNESARELMSDETLRVLAVELTQQVRNSTSIDWTVKESARAGLRVVVKRTLKKYGYPPDMQALAAETVVKQAEQLAQELTDER